MIFKPLKLATPFTAVAVAVAEPVLNVPLLSVNLTVEVSLVTTCPFVSWTATVKVSKAEPAVPDVGELWIASLEVDEGVVPLMAGTRRLTTGEPSPVTRS